MKDIESCLECENCIYIGEGDYICDEIHEIVIEDFGQPTINWMLCRKKRRKKRWAAQPAGTAADAWSGVGSTRAGIIK